MTARELVLTDKQRKVIGQLCALLDARESLGPAPKAKPSNVIPFPMNRRAGGG